MQTALNKIHAHAAVCPFCGADGMYLRYKAKAGVQFDSMGVFEQDYANVKCLMCVFCGATGPASDDANEAVTKWNRRAK